MALEQKPVASGLVWSGLFGTIWMWCLFGTAQDVPSEELIYPLGMLDGWILYGACPSTVSPPYVHKYLCPFLSLYPILNYAPSLPLCPCPTPNQLSFLKRQRSTMLPSRFLGLVRNLGKQSMRTPHTGHIHQIVHTHTHTKHTRSPLTMKVASVQATWTQCGARKKQHCSPTTLVRSARAGGAPIKALTPRGLLVLKK